MTYRYKTVRREICNLDADEKFKGVRTLKEMKQVFSWFHWVLLATLALASIAVFVLIASWPNKSFYVIPVVIILLVTITSELWGDNMYKQSERKEELEQQEHSYNKYVETISNVFIRCGVDNKEKLSLLKEECEFNLAQHKNTYANLAEKIYNILIGVPLGALISVIIYGDNAAIESIASLLLIGLMLIMVTVALRKLMFYANGFFKDERVLEAIRELEYSDFPKSE